MSLGLAMLYAWGVVTVIGLLGLFFGYVTRQDAPTLTLKPKADRDPMTAGCEMDAPTLGLPVEAETGRGRFQ